LKFLRPRLRLNGTGTRIRHLLIVSGPSGSGKSTFLAQLAADGLGAEMAAALPAGARHWPQTNGRRIMHGALEQEPGGIVPGLVLHYDFMRLFETPIEGYADDPDLGPLRAADEVTVVVLRAEAARLADQLAARPPRKRLLDPVTIALRRMIAGLGLRRKQHVYDKSTEHGRHARLVALYRDSGALAAWQERWVEYLGKAVEPASCRLLFVEPATENGNKPAFRLV
jgi:hypothetical protein